MSAETRRISAHLYEGAVRHEFSRTRIETTCVSWNPAHHDLFAYSPQKEHVVVKRRGQAYFCWKTNLDNLARCFTAPTTGYQIECLTWSPDGEVLCVTTKNGEIFLFEAELGHLLFTWRITPEEDKLSTVVNVKWEQGFRYKSRILQKPPRGGALGHNLDWIPTKKATKRLEERSWKRINESYRLLKVHQRSLRGTLLLIHYDDNSVRVLAGGLVQVAHVQPPQDFFDTNGLYLVGVDDFQLIKGTRNGNNGYTIVFSCTSQGTPPACSKGSKYGYTLEEAVQETTSEKKPVTVSHLLGVGMDAGKVSAKQIEQITESFARLYVFYFGCSEMSQCFQSSWEHEIDKLSTRFNEDEAASINFGFELLSSIYAGVRPEIQQFFERTWGTSVATELVDCYKKKLQRVVGWLPGALIPYSQALMFEATSMAELIDSIPSTSKPANDYNLLFLNLAKGFLDPDNDLSIPKDPLKTDPNPLKETTEALATSIRNLNNAVKRNYDDIEKIIGVVTKLIFREINTLLTVGPANPTEPVNRVPKIPKMAHYCMRAFMSCNPTDAIDAVLRGFFPPKDFDRLRLKDDRENPFDEQIPIELDENGRLKVTNPDDLVPRGRVDLNKIRGLFTENEVDDLIYGDPKQFTVKRALSQVTEAMKHLESNVFPRRFSRNTLEWVHEIHRGANFFGWETFSLTRESQLNQRDNLLICASQKDRGARLSRKIWKDSEEEGTADVVITFGEELEMTSLEAEQPSIGPIQLRLFGFDQFIPTSLGIVSVVVLGKDEATERRLCLLDLDKARLVIGTSDRLESPTDRVIACGRSCGNVLIICDTGHRLMVTDFLQNRSAFNQ